MTRAVYRSKTPRWKGKKKKKGGKIRKQSRSVSFSLSPHSSHTRFPENDDDDGGFYSILCIFRNQ